MLLPPHLAGRPCKPRVVALAGGHQFGEHVAEQSKPFVRALPQFRLPESGP